MNYLAPIAALVAALSLQSSVFALTITDIGTTAPTDFTYGQTSTAGGGLPPSNKTDNNKSPGETFTLGTFNFPSSYDTAVELTDVYIKGNNSTGFTGLNWTLTIGTVSGGTFTAIDTETATADATKKGYLDFNLSNYVQLSDNTLYAFTISTSNGSYAIDGTNTPNFTGDITGNSAGVNGSNNVTTGTGSRTFYLRTVPVPEPSDWAMVPVLGTALFFGLRRFRRSVA